MLLIKEVFVYDGVAAINNGGGQKLDRLGRILLRYPRKKDFQSPSKQILLKQIFRCYLQP